MARLQSHEHIGAAETPEREKTTIGKLADYLGGNPGAFPAATRLDDIPEERPLSGKPSEEKDLRHLDSGIGECDSGSASRKTSISSQGSLSPDFIMEKEVKENDQERLEDTHKRRRSGLELLNGRAPDLGLGLDTKPLRKASLPKIPKSSRASGRWERKVSAAGLSCLRMADEMEEVLRNGCVVQVPRKISDHVPVIPIHSVDRFIVTETNENLGLEDEELQIYKTPKSDVYQLHRHRWEFFGKLDFRKTLLLALDGEAWLSGVRKYELLIGLVSEKEQRKMEKMLAKGYTHEEIVEHFIDDASKKSGNMDLANKLQELLNDENMNEDEIVDAMKKELGKESQLKMEELLKQGHSIQDVMKIMKQEGRTQEEETRDTAETLAHLMKSKKKNIKTNSKEIEAMLNERLDPEAKEKMRKMLAEGANLQDVLDYFIENAEPEEELSALEKKVKQLTKGADVSPSKMFDILKGQMDSASGKKMEEMLKSGCTLEEVIEHFMKKGKTKEEAQMEKSGELRQKLEGKDLSDEDIIELLRAELGPEDKAQLEKMLKKGCPISEISEHFLNRGIDAEPEDKSEFMSRIEALIGDKNLSDDEILAIMKSQIDDEMKAEIKAMQEKGYSNQDIINHLKKNVKTDEEKSKETTKKLSKLFDDQEMSEDEKVTLLQKQLNETDQAQMGEMLKRGCSIEEVIAHFMNRSKSPEKDKSCFAKHIDNLTAGKSLTIDETFDIVKEELDEESKIKLEEMLQKGYTKEDIVNHFLRTAKTKEEKLQETADKIKALICDQNMSDENKLEILKNQLSQQELEQIEHMLSDGGSLEEVMQQIWKNKTLENATESELSKMLRDAMTANNDLTTGELLTMIKENVDSEAHEEIRMLLEKGFTEQEVIDHFLAHGKTIKEKQKELSEKIRGKLSMSDISPEESLNLMKTMLSGKDVAQLELMLEKGCSLEEVLHHFSNRGIDEPGQGPSDFAIKIKKLSQGKCLTSEQMLCLMEKELSEEGKELIGSMLDKGYSAEDIVNHLMNHGRTQEERNKEISTILSKLVNLESMSAEEIELILKEQLPKQDMDLMQKMLKQGKDIKTVIKHFLERTEITRPDSPMQIRIKKLSGARKLSNEEMILLIKDQLGEKSREELVKMLSRGASLDDVIEHFLHHGKTKKEEETDLIETLKKSVMNASSEEEIKKLLEEKLSEEDRNLMETLMEEGKSMKEIAEYFVKRNENQPTESDLSTRVKKASGGRKLSNEEILELLKDNLGNSGKEQMESMVARGIPLEDVISHFMEFGKTEEEENKELRDQLERNDLSKLSQAEKQDFLSKVLSHTDKKEMEQMLNDGFSIDDVIEHFQVKSQGIEETELVKTIKKLSRNKKLSTQDMVNLIKEQLSDDSKEKMAEMLKGGMSEKDVIDFFMKNGKTCQEEQREVGENLRKMSNSRKLSKEEMMDVMSTNLGKCDRAQMENMLKNGCTVEEVFDMFMNRGTTPDLPQTELAKRVKKYSRGRLLPQKEILRLIKFQLSEEGKVQLDKMLEKGYREEDVIEHFMTKGKTYDEEYRKVAEKLVSMIDVNSMSESKILDIMKSVLGTMDQSQLEEMIRRGCTTPDILDLFVNRGKRLKTKTEFSARMERLLEGKCLAPQDILAIMQENLDDESREAIPTLIERGYTIQDVIEHLWKHGKTPEQVQKEVAEKMLALLDGNITEDQVIAMMKKQIGVAGCKEIEDMMSKGCSLTEILDFFLHKQSELEIKEEDTEFAKKIKSLMGDQVLSSEEMMKLIVNELDSNSKDQLDEMKRCGCSNEEVIQHFMTRERNKKGQKRNEFGRKIYELTKDKKLTKKELLCLMRNHLDDDSLKKLEDMVKKGYPTEDIIDYFLKNGKTPNQALREKTQQKEKAKREASKRIHKLVEGNNLSNDEILAILKLQMGDDDKEQLDTMMKKGCSSDEIIKHFMRRDDSEVEGEKTLFEQKMEELMEGKDLSNEEILDLMRNELDDDALEQMTEMLNKGYTKEDVIKYFMKHGDEGNDFVQEMKKLEDETKDMSKDDILNIMKKKLGVMSQKKMEDMKREGYSAEDIIRHLMTHGKTQEQETALFTRRMSIILEGEKGLSEKEKVDKLRQNLGKEAAFMVDELMKNGFSYGHIIDLFLKHGNDVNSLVGDSFFFRFIIFPPEPQDTLLHKNRDVFTVIDRDETKKRISYMSPSGKTHIFGLFFEMVLDVINGKGLTHREILDLMRSRMGAGYATEFDDLRKKGLSLQQIVNYFLKRDEETIAESRLVAKLKAEARVDSRVYLKREYSKEKWGVSLTYTHSKNHGLHLILDDVVENGPAWESGVRAGDVIVTVNDWLIVLMDRPQVAAHLFQAGANIVKLGIQKTRGASPDTPLGVY